MSVIPKLASSLNRRDEVPNQELAQAIIAKRDTKAIQELVDHLIDKNKDIQSDCIKVLYEIGEHQPALIAEHAKSFILLLDSKNNRMQWGAMTALSSIVQENPQPVYAVLSKIIEIGEKGSVITRDHCVNILIRLASIKQYAENAFVLLIEQLHKCPTNQLPMYAENAIPVINEKNKTLFIKTLTSRMDEIEKEPKRKRVEKVIKKVS
jgi:hypothetical protein